jgi:hypothetical protein
MSCVATTGSRSYDARSTRGLPLQSREACDDGATENRLGYATVISHLRLLFPIDCESRSFGGCHPDVIPAFRKEDAGQFSKRHFLRKSRTSIRRFPREGESLRCYGAILFGPSRRAKRAS